MRTVFKILCLLLLVFGGLTVMFGLFALFTAKLMRNEPPPSMNEGPALLGFIGFFATILGTGSLVVGLALRAGLRALSNQPKPD